MIGNRSVPTDVVLPHLIYQDLHAAVAWLTSTFGFTEHYRYGDPVAGVQMSLGKAWIMLSGPKPGAASPEKTGYRTQSLTIQSRGIAASEPQVGNGLWDTRLIDPDGYYLHFESPTDVPEETRLPEVKA